VHPTDILLNPAPVFARKLEGCQAAESLEHTNAPVEVPLGVISEQRFFDLPGVELEFTV